MKHSNIYNHAIREFEIAGWLDENGKFKDEMQETICSNMLELVEIFSKQGHSGFSASYLISHLTNLLKFKPLTPLTGEDSEWNLISEEEEGLYQNNRLSSVFKDKNCVYDIDGIVFWEWTKYFDEETGKSEVFKSYYTSKNSRVEITFPYTQPDSPEYVFVPSEEFPNEVLDS